MSRKIMEDTRDSAFIESRIRSLETSKDIGSRHELERLKHIEQRLKEAERLKKIIRKQRRLLVAARESLSDLFNETID